jgi:hypothetical protein
MFQLRISPSSDEDDLIIIEGWSEDHCKDNLVVLGKPEQVLLKFVFE